MFPQLILVGISYFVLVASCLAGPNTAAVNTTASPIRSGSVSPADGMSQQLYPRIVNILKVVIPGKGDRSQKTDIRPLSSQSLSLGGYAGPEGRSRSAHQGAVLPPSNQITPSRIPSPARSLFSSGYTGERRATGPSVVIASYQGPLRHQRIPSPPSVPQSSQRSIRPRRYFSPPSVPIPFQSPRRRMSNPSRRTFRFRIYRQNGDLPRVLLLVAVLAPIVPLRRRLDSTPFIQAHRSSKDAR